MVSQRKYGFPPVVDGRTEILFLGTLPGGESLEKQQYYADYDNLFWDLIYRVLDVKWDIDLIVKEESSYKERCDFLLQNRIGIWDVLSSAERDSSSDNKIKNEKYNDFQTFLVENSKIRIFLFNGQNAFKFMKRKFPKLLKQYEYSVINSSSPQNSTNTFWILKEWKAEILSAINRLKQINFNTSIYESN